MDTVPPPDGEDDAYSAATKIGSMSRGLVEAMMAQSQADERSATLAPISETRNFAIPKPARMPTITGGMSREAEVQRLYDHVAEGDAFDPIALFGPAGADGSESGVRAGSRSIIEDLGPAPPARSDAAWTQAPTLLAMSVVPLPSTTALAPLLEPASTRLVRHRSTFAIEVAIFLGTFVVIAIPAALAYFHWMR